MEVLVSEEEVVVQEEEEETAGVEEEEDLEQLTGEIIEEGLSLGEEQTISFNFSFQIQFNLYYAQLIYELKNKLNVLIS